MAQPVLEFYDTDDQEITTIDFGSIVGGEYSDVVEIRLWNDKGGTEGSVEAQNIVVKALNATGEESGDLVEQAWVEYKIGDAEDTATPTQIQKWYSPLGLNFYASFEPIQSNTYRTMYLRLRAPLGLSTEALTFQITPSIGAVVIPVSVLEREVIGNGVIRETQTNGLRYGEITTDGSDTITITALDVMIGTKHVTHNGTTIAFDQDDVNSDTLTSDELYYAVVSLDTDGGLNVTKGAKGTAPVIPDLPEGELGLAVITVLFNDVETEITDDEVDFLPSYIEFHGKEIESTTFQVHPGRGVSGTNYLVVRSPFNVVLSEGENYVMLSPEGAITVDDEIHDTHLLLYRVTHTSGTNVITDKRTYLHNAFTPAKVDKYITFNTRDSAEYTLTLADDGKMVEMDHAASQAIVVPHDDAVNFPIGTQVLFAQTGSGKLTIMPASDVVFVPEGSYELLDRGYVGALVKRFANTWYIFGNIVEAE